MIDTQITALHIFSGYNVCLYKLCFVALLFIKMFYLKTVKQLSEIRYIYVFNICWGPAQSAHMHTRPNTKTRLASPAFT